MKIVIGCDHAAYELKEAVKAKLEGEGYEVMDVGCHSTESVDYPKYGHAVGKAVASGEADRFRMISAPLTARLAERGCGTIISSQISMPTTASSPRQNS